MPPKPRTYRIGEKRMQNCRLEAEIVGYRKANDMDVRFPDGTIVEHRGYNEFKKGNIAHPGIDRYKKQTDRIGETRMQNCGLEAKIIGYRNKENIDIRFPDGTVITHRTYKEFKKGTIAHPDINRYKNKKQTDRIGETHMQNCGLEAEIVGYRNTNDIDVRFPDGTTVKHRKYNQFKTGSIAHPDINRYRYKNKKQTDRIGETHIQNCGLEAEIVGYRKANDMDVRFPDGTVITHRTYKGFKKGNIAHPDINRYKKQTDRIGETRMQKCGLEAEIIGYHNTDDMDVIFPDGSTIEHKKYYDFTKKTINHPTMNPQFNKNIGKIYPKGKSKIYHTEIHGIAYIINDTYYYFCHCPICGTQEIWTFNEIKSHKCNQKLVKERDEFIQTLKTQSNVSVA